MTYTEKVILSAKKRLSDIRGKIVVGFSGGADSTVLLEVMRAVFDEENITAVHINHMLRGKEADADEEFCRSFAKDRGIGFVCRRIDVAALSRGKAVEETARNARYGALEAVARETNSAYIALAHTASDNLETVIFNLCRGSGTAGMRGIPFSRPCGEATVIRPLIDCTRAEIEGFAAENGLSFVTDKTNADTHYTRNYIRHEIVPKIKEIFPSAESAAVNMTNAVSTDYDYISSEAEKLLETAENGKLPLSVLRESHPALILRAVSKLSPVTLDFAHQNEILETILSGGEGKISVPEGKYAVCDGKNLFFSEGEDAPRPEYEMTLSEGLNFSDYGFCIAVGETVAAPEGQELVGTGYAPKNALLTARSRRSSDKYRFWKMTRTLKKMIGDLDENAKKYRPVICADGKPIWLPGFPSEEISGGEKIKIRYYKAK